MHSINEKHSNESIKTFGMHIKSLRKIQGLTAEQLAELISRDSNVKIGRTTINAIENGYVKLIKPDVMKGLANALNQNINTLVSYWTSDIYELDKGNIVKMEDHSGVVLKISESWMKAKDSDDRIHNTVRNLPENISLITLNELKNIQSKLPSGSRVYVAATDFLDDDMFFDMVFSNLKKGVLYFYFLEDHLLYRRFLELLREAGWNEEVDGDLDGNLTFLLSSNQSIDALHIHRNSSFPLNSVLIHDPDHGVQAYSGMIVDDRPAYYQVADIGLTYRVKAAFEGLSRIELG